MNTKHKSIALAVCLLLTQNHGMYGYDGIAKAAQGIGQAIVMMYTSAMAVGGIVGAFGIYDAVTDCVETYKQQRERNEYIANTSNIARDFQLKLGQENIRKKAEEKFPQLTTPLYKRIIKGVAGGILLAGALHEIYHMAPHLRQK